MVKRVYLIHGWGGGPETDFFVWLTKELERKGFEVHALEMPDTENPIIEKWISHLEKEVGKPDKETYFIGHSIGCQAIMRYLEKIDAQVGGALFVAGWFNLANLEEDELETARPWIENPINFDKLKENLGKITVLISDNDPYGCLDENVKIFKEKLNANVIIKPNAEHFNDPKYGFILDEIIKLAK